MQTKHKREVFKDLWRAARTVSLDGVAQILKLMIKHFQGLIMHKTTIANGKLGAKARFKLQWPF